MVREDQLSRVHRLQRFLRPRADPRPARSPRGGGGPELRAAHGGAAERHGRDGRARQQPAGHRLLDLPPLDAYFAALGGEGKLVLLLKGDRHDRFDARLAARLVNRHEDEEGEADGGRGARAERLGGDENTDLHRGVEGVIDLAAEQQGLPDCHLAILLCGERDLVHRDCDAHLAAVQFGGEAGGDVHPLQQGGEGEHSVCIQMRVVDDLGHGHHW
mmetsp:Transcript_1717/g.5559  ORF Transcript_1717/g.5559 Transcript_1717/m.5559 type:complete len:216 (-) Transcript_1717:112-759(-)